MESDRSPKPDGQPPGRLVATIHQPPASTVELDFTSGQVIATEPFWFYWARIARDHAARAEEAADGRDPYSVIGNEELLASVVAVTAAAHSLDSIYGAIRSLVNLPPSHAARQRQILEALKHGFAVGKLQHEWLPEIDWLFRLRDPAVHHTEDGLVGTLVRQPDGSLLGRSAESEAFTAVAARRAADLAISIVTHCVRHPKAATRDWATHRRGLLDRL